VTITARVPAGIREGGQYATTTRPEPSVTLPSPSAGGVSSDVDELEGACWDVPEDVPRDQALVVENFPLEKIAWWAADPDHDYWCECGTCPREPGLAPDDVEGLELCSGGRIAHYAACIERGDQFPPLQVLHDPAGQDWDGKPHTLLVDDGHHRLSAYLLLGRTTAPADVYAADYAAAAAALT